MEEQRPATPDEVRLHTLRGLLPRTYGTEEAQKALRKADERLAKLEADKRAERAESDAQWTEHQHRSLACLIGREELERRYAENMERVRSAEETPLPDTHPTAPMLTPEQLAVLTAASIDPTTADAATIAAVLQAANLGGA